MKKIITAPVILSLLSANTLPVVQYDPFYKSKAFINAVKKQKKTQPKKQEILLILSAIFNKHAFINNKFYTIGEKVYGYKIKKIYRQSVVLQSRKKVKILRLQEQKLLKITHIAKREDL